MEKIISNLSVRFDFLSMMTSLILLFFNVSFVVSFVANSDEEDDSRKLLFY